MPQHLGAHWDYTNNLTALCPKEHDALHRGEFTMTGNANIAGNLKFYDARGRQIPTPANQTRPTAHHQHHHPARNTHTPPANDSTPDGSASAKHPPQSPDVAPQKR
jgi:hypothetical protein